jgi:hypothetical protein
MSTLGDTADVNPVIKFLPHTVNQVARAPMPRHLPQLRQRIVEAVAAIDRQMLRRVVEEFDYRVDICRVTKGEHIEHL